MDSSRVSTVAAGTPAATHGGMQYPLWKTVIPPASTKRCASEMEAHRTQTAATTEHQKRVEQTQLVYHAIIGGLLLAGSVFARRARQRKSLTLLKVYTSMLPVLLACAACATVWSFPYRLRGFPEAPLQEMFSPLQFGFPCLRRYFLVAWRVVRQWFPAHYQSAHVVLLLLQAIFCTWQVATASGLGSGKRKPGETSMPSKFTRACTSVQGNAAVQQNDLQQCDGSAAEVMEACQRSSPDALQQPAGSVTETNNTTDDREAAPATAKDASLRRREKGGDKKQKQILGGEQSAEQRRAGWSSTATQPAESNDECSQQAESDNEGLQEAKRSNSGSKPMCVSTQYTGLLEEHHSGQGRVGDEWTRIPRKRQAETEHKVTQRSWPYSQSTSLDRLVWDSPAVFVFLVVVVLPIYGLWMSSASNGFSDEDVYISASRQPLFPPRSARSSLFSSDNYMSLLLSPPASSPLSSSLLLHPSAWMCLYAAARIPLHWLPSSSLRWSLLMPEIVWLALLLLRHVLSVEHLLGFNSSGDSLQGQHLTPEQKGEASPLFCGGNSVFHHDDGNILSAGPLHTLGRLSTIKRAASEGRCSELGQSRATTRTPLSQAAAMKPEDVFRALPLGPADCLFVAVQIVMPALLMYLRRRGRAQASEVLRNQRPFGDVVDLKRSFPEFSPADHIEVTGEPKERMRRDCNWNGDGLQQPLVAQVATGHGGIQGLRGSGPALYEDADGDVAHAFYVVGPGNEVQLLHTSRMKRVFRPQIIK